MSHRLPTRSLAVAAAALTVLLAGCGATGGNQVADAGSAAAAAERLLPQSLVTEAAATSGAVETQKVHLELTAEVDGDQLALTSDGAFDLPAERAHVTVDLGEDGPLGVGPMELVYDHDTVYVKGEVADLLSDGKAWVSFTSPKIADAVAKLDGGLQPDPAATMDFLEGVGSPVRDLGREEVRGVDTRHLGVQLSPRKALDRADPDRRQQLEDLLDRRGIDLDRVEPIPAEVWIDDDGYVRRVTMTYDLGSLAGALGSRGSKVADELGTMTETLEVYDVGQPVEIAVPAADDVHPLDLSKLLGD